MEALRKLLPPFWKRGAAAYIARQMRIAVPTESDPRERRVAVTPDVVAKRSGGEVGFVVQAGCGIRAGFGDEEYRQAGAEVAGGLDHLKGAEAVAVVGPPAPEIISRLSPGTVLVGLLQPLERPEAMAELAAAGLTAFAFELVPRATRAQTMDALSSQATVAGYEAVLLAASSLGRFFPMLTTAAGTIAPAKVLVLGAGVAGLQAIATSRRLGAMVSAYDVRADAAEQVESLGAGFVTLEVEPQDATAAGGYARELEMSAQERLLAGLAEHVARADVVVTTAAIPGRPAPRLVTADMVRSMRRGSVIVDLAASSGGNCELTRPDQVVETDGVTVLGPTDLVGRAATHASQMYARNVAALFELIFPEGKAVIDLGDEIISGACVTHDVEVIHPRVRELLAKGRG